MTNEELTAAFLEYVKANGRNMYEITVDENAFAFLERDTNDKRKVKNCLMLEKANGQIALISSTVKKRKSVKFILKIIGAGILLTALICLVFLLQH